MEVSVNTKGKHAWVILSDYITLRENKAGFKSFRQHIFSGSRFLGASLMFSLFLSFIPGIRSFPLLKTACLSVQKILNGYLTELYYSNSQVENLPILKDYSYPNFVEDTIFDFIIIGSGPGAATAFQNIPKHSKVLVLEKGMLPMTPNQEHHTLKHVRQDFEKGGKELIVARGFPQYAQGSVLGGGSEVNSGLYHPLPNKHLDSYLAASGVSEAQWLESETSIRDLLRIEVCEANLNHSLIAKSAQHLGFEFMNVPRWRHYDNSECFKHFGMNNLIWLDAEDNKSVYILTGHEVKSIENSNKLYISINTMNQHRKKLKFRAREVIVSAGTISSPFLLAESGLIGWGSIGFQWHPMIRRIVEVDPLTLGLGDIDPYQAWTDDMRFKFGSAVSTPGLLAIAMNRKLTIDQVRTLRSYYVSFGSTGKGGLVPYTKVPWYKFSAKDYMNLEKAATALDSFISASEGRIIGNQKSSISTVHIFGSLPIGTSNFIPGTIRLRADSRILVADGSILPEPPSVNPQATIMALVHATTKNRL